jgi:L-aminopeptidase/D-esterase-like protein
MSNLAGLSIGHATDEETRTGCTVFLCPPGTIGGIDVRGPAPGSRETEILSPYKPVTTINSVLLTGGAAFGLAAADGVVNYLAERKMGHPTLMRPVPIVSAAVIDDMLMGSSKKPPDASLGYDACLAASESDPAQGNIGVGIGATVGKWGGFTTMMKGGFGLAKARADELIVFAAAVTNCIGDVIHEDGSVLAGARSEDGQWLADQDPYRRFPVDPSVSRGENTTLVVVGTNAKLNKVETNRLAQRAHDGMAIAVRPTHTSFDGDSAYALATCTVDAHFDLVANIAVEVVAGAIRNSVRYARSLDDIRGLYGS